MTHALIVGAGIGGLATALSLHAAGIEATVVDSVSALRPLGVGINLLPHAVRELIELGLGERLAALAVPTAEFVHFDRFGNRIWSEPRGRALGYRWPQYAVHRGELQALLADAVCERLGPGAIRTGLAFEDFEQDAAGVRAALRTRDGERIVTTAAVLIGADGILSAVRARLHPGEGAPLWNGIRMWRGVTETAPFLGGRSLAVAGSNKHVKFVAYAISKRAEDAGRAQLNWVAEVRISDDPGLRQIVDWSREGKVEDVLPHYADWKFDWLDVPGIITGAPAILEYPMVDRDPLPWWSLGRVTLLGDAAHPMYPVGSNGGTQAIVDARVLAYELARATGPVAGLAAYDAARRPAAGAIQTACREMPAERVLQMVSERAPDGFERIEDVLSGAELAAIETAYLKTTGSDVRTLNSRPSLTPHTPPRPS